jgi:hypothetical protein
MKITSTTAVHLTKKEVVDALLEKAGIELKEGQTATLRVYGEPFKQHTIYISSDRKES